MYTKTGVKLMENIDKMNEDGNISSLGNKMSQNVLNASEAHLLNTSNVASLGMYTKLTLYQPKRFDKMTKDRYFDLLWRSKWPENWAFLAHILHTPKTTSHEQQHWCKRCGHFFRKWPKDGILTYLGAQDNPMIRSLKFIFYTPLKVAAMTM